MGSKRYEPKEQHPCEFPGCKRAAKFGKRAGIWLCSSHYQKKYDKPNKLLSEGTCKHCGKSPPGNQVVQQKPGSLCFLYYSTSTRKTL